MMAMILHFLLALCGVSLVGVLICIFILYSAWRMSRPDNGWDR